MIYPEHSSGAAEDVSALAVGIVDQDIENGEQPQLGPIGVDHRNRCVVRSKPVHAGEPAVASMSSSTHRCSDPGPSGPSTSTVHGTRSKPPIRDTSYAATSRSPNVRCGKSHRGRSPWAGL